MDNQKPANRLIHEKSPYLLQHAHNPVNWYPWGEQAFAKAKQEDKPIFLSIGYSTCHWCHVMERESFEDDQVAELLNRDYVSIKVDREERPDIDHIYMEVCQRLTGQGGWPLTIIMTPDQQPFFAGTYFPKQGIGRRMGLMELLPQIQRAWHEDRAHIQEVCQQITTMLTKQPNRLRAVDRLTDELLAEAVEQLQQEYDPEDGGFGGAPKFPMPQRLLFLLHRYERNRDQDVLNMVCHTLDRMRRGGIYDQLGFGFARYSVDAGWRTPHFEKMLYDNALLSYCYTEAFRVTGQLFYGRVAGEILDYVLRDLTDRQGCFYTAEDADSEGVEGKFYVWTDQQISDVLGEEQGKIVAEYYGVTPAGNFEQGSNILRAPAADGEFAARHLLSAEQLAELLETSRQKLLAVRERRIRPFRDDKIVTAWNGLMIAALARAGKVFASSHYIDAARQACAFIMQNLQNNGRLQASYRNGQTGTAGYLDDYACMLWAIVELYDATLDPVYLEQGLKMVMDMKTLFWDPHDEGFYLTGEDSEQLLTRPKEWYDGAMPCGNSVAAAMMVRLARMTGDIAVTRWVEELFSAASGYLHAQPLAHLHLLAAFDTWLAEPRNIVITGSGSQATVQTMLATVKRLTLPDTYVIHYDPDRSVAEQLTQLNEQYGAGRRAAAYVCEHFSCREPIYDAGQLHDVLHHLSQRTVEPPAHRGDSFVMTDQPGAL